VLHDSACCASLLDLLGPTRLNAQNGKELTLSISNVKDDILHQGKNFQTKSNIGMVKDDILLDGIIGWIDEVTCEIRASWLRSEWTPCRVLGRTCRYKSTIRAK
jgi:hypothetical protein